MVVVEEAASVVNSAHPLEALGGVAGQLERVTSSGSSRKELRSVWICLGLSVRDEASEAVSCESCR